MDDKLQEFWQLWGDWTYESFEYLRRICSECTQALSEFVEALQQSFSTALYDGAPNPPKEYARQKNPRQFKVPNIRDAYIKRNKKLAYMRRC